MLRLPSSEKVTANDKSKILPHEPQQSSCLDPGVEYLSDFLALPVEPELGYGRVDPFRAVAVDCSPFEHFLLDHCSYSQRSVLRSVETSIPVVSFAGL